MLRGKKGNLVLLILISTDKNQTAPYVVACHPMPVVRIVYPRPIQGSTPLNNPPIEKHVKNTKSKWVFRPFCTIF